MLGPTSEEKESPIGDLSRTRGYAKRVFQVNQVIQKLFQPIQIFRRDLDEFDSATNFVWIAESNFLPNHPAQDFDTIQFQFGGKIESDFKFLPDLHLVAEIEH